MEINDGEQTIVRTCRRMFGRYFVLFMSGVLLALLTAESRGADCTASGCHQALVSNKHMHAAAFSCESCHIKTTDNHPQKGKKGFSLMQDVPALCRNCHSQDPAEKNAHAPYAGGMCLSCHEPHSTEQAKLLRQAAGDLCLGCHPDKTSSKNVHGPTATGDCTACHRPHSSPIKGLLVKEGAEVCFLCHLDIQEEMKKKVPHGAVAGGCTVCHNPHGSDERKLLTAAGEKLCYQCHAEVGEKVAKAASVHAPLKSDKGCASCHSPHSGVNRKLTQAEGRDLCLTCHKGFIKKGQTVLHGPIRDGKCTPCHDPHGGAGNRLLKAEHPSDTYIDYKDDRYGLCFSCHNRDLLKYPDTSFATGFRDGNQNLHYLHVNRQDKGRNCRLCHEMHGGQTPRLIAERVPFGKWDLPLKYVKTDNGGSCAPGCHRKFSYDRQSPVNKTLSSKPMSANASQQDKR